jgi:hypothetical protein
MSTVDSIGALLKPRDAKKYGPQLVAVAEKIEGDENVVTASVAHRFLPDMTFSGIALLTETRLVVSLWGGGRALLGSFKFEDTPYVMIIRDVATIGPADFTLGTNKMFCRELASRIAKAGGVVTT